MRKKIKQKNFTHEWNNIYDYKIKYELIYKIIAEYK
jgi:hypothetical protein